MLASDNNNTVLSEVRKDGRESKVYTAYGHSATVGSIGFNGELCDKQTGWYLLGNGYRAYNPWLMRFQSPDSLSPFGKGGVNAYTYVQGDPVNFTDPTGHAIWGFGWLAKLFGSSAKVGKAAAKGGKAAQAAKPDRLKPVTKVKTTDNPIKARRARAKANREKTVFDRVAAGEKDGTFVPEKYTSESLKPRPDVKGKKWGDDFREPQTGWDQIKKVLSDGVVQDRFTKGTNSSALGGNRKEAAASIAGVKTANTNVRSGK